LSSVRNGDPVKTMLNRAMFDIVRTSGQRVLQLVAQMQSEEELFASANTLGAIEDILLEMAHTIGNLTPAMRGHLPQLDWTGWRALHRCLRADLRPRREAVWYAIRSLVPATLELFDRLRRRQPFLFEIGY
jgi:uncharacterized protein with HEPN domain